MKLKVIYKIPTNYSDFNIIVGYQQSKLIHHCSLPFQVYMRALPSYDRSSLQKKHNVLLTFVFISDLITAIDVADIVRLVFNYITFLVQRGTHKKTLSGTDKDFQSTHRRNGLNTLNDNCLHQ